MRYLLTKITILCYLLLKIAIYFEILGHPCFREKVRLQTSRVHGMFFLDIILESLHDQLLRTSRPAPVAIYNQKVSHLRS